MKKRNYFIGAMALCGMLAFSSCSDDNDPIPVGPETPEIAAGDQVIVLDMQNTDVLATKSRPLNSTQNMGAEQVTDVMLYIFKEGKTTQDGTDVPSQKTLLRTIHIANWDQISQDHTSSSSTGLGRKYSYRLKDSEKLKINKTAQSSSDSEINDGDQITIVAVGQNERNTTARPQAFKIFQFPTAAVAGTANYVSGLGVSTDQSSNTWNSDPVAGKGFLLTDSVHYACFSGVKENTSDNALGDSTRIVAEIFSGTSVPAEVTLDGGFQSTVLLKRQVAGVLGYFNRIPARLPKPSATAVDSASVCMIRLVASNRNNRVDLTNNLGVQEDDATYGEPEYKSLEWVVNGFSDEGSSKNINQKDAYTYDMSGQKTKSFDAYVIYTIDLRRWFPRMVQSSGYIWKDADIYNNNNLLPDSAWNNPLSMANVHPTLASGAVFAGEFVIPFEKTQANTFELQLVDSTGYNVLKKWNVKLVDQKNPNVAESDLSYGIYRNHLYQIGKRGSGDDPNNPGGGGDIPQPLDKDQDLIIHINDNWEVIHDLEIE